VTRTGTAADLSVGTLQTRANSVWSVTGGRGTSPVEGSANRFRDVWGSGPGATASWRQRRKIAFWKWRASRMPPRSAFRSSSSSHPLADDADVLVHVSAGREPPFEPSRFKPPALFEGPSSADQRIVSPECVWPSWLVVSTPASILVRAARPRGTMLVLVEIRRVDPRRTLDAPRSSRHVARPPATWKPRGR